MTEEEKEYLIKVLNDVFKNKTIKRIREHNTADEGILIEFNENDSLVLFIGYSGCSGHIQIRF